MENVKINNQNEYKSRNLVHKCFSELNLIRIRPKISCRPPNKNFFSCFSVSKQRLKSASEGKASPNAEPSGVKALQPNVSQISPRFLSEAADRAALELEL